jgi:hypothetical protein
MQEAEMAERIGDLTEARKLLDLLKNFEEADKHQNRISALETKLSSAAASK